jgi:amino acid permease
MVIVIFLYLLAPLNAYIKIIGKDTESCSVLDPDSHPILLGDYTSEVIQLFWPSTKESVWSSSAVLVPLLTVFLVSPVSFYRNLDSLSKLSLFCVACLYYMVIVIIFDFASMKSAGDPLPEITWFRFSITGMAKTSSTLLMAFNSVPNILGVFEELKRPTTARQVVVVSFTSFAAFLCYASIGLFGYLVFGDNVSPNVAQEKTTGPYILARLLIGLSMGFSWPLVVFPARNCLEWMLDCVANSVPSFKKVWDRLEPYRFNGLTIFLVFFSIGLTYAFKDLGQILSLFGTVVATNLMLTVPCVFMLLMGQKLNIRPWEKIACYLVIILGMFLFVAGIMP